MSNDPISPKASSSPRSPQESPPRDMEYNASMIVTHMSNSHMSLAESVEQAQNRDPDSFREAQKVASRDAGKNKWSSTALPKLFIDLNSQPEGLTDTQVTENREKYGMNILEKEDREPVWRTFLRQFQSVVVLMLIAAAIASLALQEFVEGVAILLIVIVNGIIATWSEKSAEDALAKLAAMSAPRCTVKRNGKIETIDAKECVVGDVIVLKTGDSCPADARLIQCTEILCNEALLTGESEEVEKRMIIDDLDEPFAKNMTFGSTSITNGNGECLVVTTGMNTQVGIIAQQLKSASSNKSTPLQRGLHVLGSQIGIISLSILVIIVVVAVVTDYRDPAHPDANKVLQIVLVAVGFAVSSIPEGLPMVVTICLAMGCRDMVARKAQIRKLPAVETLGSCTVVCSDKTGTLTEGKMTAIQMVACCRESGRSADYLNKFEFYPTKGFDPNGGIFISEDLNQEIKGSMAKLYDKGQFQDYGSCLTDQGDPTTQGIHAAICRVFLLSGYLNSSDTQLKKDDSHRWQTSGNMSEGAIVVAAAKARIGPIEGHLENDPHTLYTRVKDVEVPFNSSRKMAASVHKLISDNEFDKLSLSKPGTTFTHVAIIKGAPDRVWQWVTHTLVKNGNTPAIDWNHRITSDELKGLESTNLDLSKNALRVLGLTLRPLTDADIKHMRMAKNAEVRLDFLLGKNDDKTKGENGLVALGVIGSLDPPRVGVADAIATCRCAGVRVIMITGDQQPTATAIAREIGLIRPGEEKLKVVHCQDLHEDDGTNIGDENMDTITSNVNVFSRAQPEDKIAIVKSLQRQQEVCAMTGDGVNDAPALKQADIGVAMGIAGTDVAKGAADMVLIDDNFVTIVVAIEEGRKIYGNIQKFVCFLLGTNIGEIIYLMISIAAFFPLPLHALQILFLNLMSDGCPAVAIAQEPCDATVMIVRHNFDYSCCLSILKYRNFSDSPS
eukprot:GHVL01031371.1.p1 GENE.GHVL01031371.1~~GHVL01031371.1.p1  ORF type:complete len:953 (+),score=176.45 GHVL01031371.1:70-2928(+)